MRVRIPLPAFLLRDFDHAVGGGVDRDKLDDSDFAGKNRSFPIVTQADVSDALSSIGRAGSDNYSHDELHSRIISIAKRKGFTVPGDKEKEADDPAVENQGRLVKMQPRTRIRINTDGPRRVESDHGGRVPLPTDLSRTKVTMASEQELHDPYGLDCDIDYPKLDMTASAVQYQNYSEDPSRACHACRFYDPDCDGDSECSIVAGNIRPLGTCNLFEEPFSTGVGSTDQEDSDEDAEMSDQMIQCGEFAWGVEFAEGKPIQIMRTGQFNHPSYGKFAITESDLAEIVANFNDNVRGQSIPIDINHDHGIAVGWMKNLQVDGDKLFATPDWTDEGANAVRDGKYRYFSPHFGPWEDPETGKKHRLVLMSGAVTNFPFLKNMEPLSLSEFSQKKEKGDKMEFTEEEIKEMQRKLSEAETRATEAENRAQMSDAQMGAITSQQKELAETVEAQRLQLAGMQHNALVLELTSIVHGDGNPNERWIGDEEQQVTFLVKLSEAFGRDSSEVAHYISEQKANAARLRAGNLFKETGSSAIGARGTDIAAMSEVEKKLAEIESGGKTHVEAIMELGTKFPELYKQYNDATVRKSAQEG